MIAATAIAAIIQLRHLRSSNQLAALTECREVIESQRFFAARRFLEVDLSNMMKQPGFVARLKPRIMDDELEPAQFVGNFFENMGAFVKYGIIDKDIACDLWGGAVLSSWRLLFPITRVRREALDPALLENFEFLAVLCEDFVAKHPLGTYPKGMRRMPDA